MKNLDTYKESLTKSAKYIVYLASLGLIGYILFFSFNALNVEGQAAEYANEKQVELQSNNLSVSNTIQERLEDLVTVDTNVEPPTGAGEEKNPFERN